MSMLPGDARVYYAEISQTLESSPVRVEAYEKFLTGVDSVIRHTYQAAAFGEGERPGPEKDLLVRGQIANVFIPAVSTILRQTLPALQPEIDRMAIYLGDYAWLGFGDDPRTESFRRNRDVDILRKTILRKNVNVNDAITTTNTADGSTPTSGENKNGNSSSSNVGQRWRRCVHCCECTSDLGFPRSAVAFRIFLKIGLIRSCVCGGTFVVESVNSASGMNKRSHDLNT